MGRAGDGGPPGSIEPMQPLEPSAAAWGSGRRAVTLRGWHTAAAPPRRHTGVSDDIGHSTGVRPRPHPKRCTGGAGTAHRTQGLDTLSLPSST